jgi:hypothetical protein
MQAVAELRRTEMQTSIALAPPMSKRMSRVRRHRFSLAACFFLAFFVLYIGVAAVLVFKGNAIEGDGISRVAIANRILFSRDPHLAAIGFVWSPLPELLLLPLVPFKFLWPALVQLGFAGNILSSLFMAGAVYQLFRLLEDLGVRRGLRIAMTLCFALHPMIVLFGANSMTEPELVFFLLLISRRLTTWLRTGEVGPLVATGFYLALAYLARYEGAAAAAAVTGVVLFVAFGRSRGTMRVRSRAALCDGLIVSAPFVAAFAVWAITSWLVTGVAFQQFSSAYGTEPQLQARGLVHFSLSQDLTAAIQAVHWMLSLEPFLPVATLVLIVAVLKRRDWVAAGAPVAMWAVLAFMFWAHTSGTILRQPRYFIVVIPLTIVMLGLVLGSAGGAAPVSAIRFRRRPSSRLIARGVAVTSAVLMLVVALPSGVHAVLDPSISAVEAYPLQALLNRGTLTTPQRLASLRWVNDRAIAAYLDSLHLRSGAVLVDDFLGFVIVTSSQNSHQFVITSDRDFQQVLAAPSDNGVEYVLVPTDHDLGKLDAINRAFPGIYANGGGVGKLVKEFIDHSDSEYNWRLYRVS